MLHTTQVAMSLNSSAKFLVYYFLRQEYKTILLLLAVYFSAWWNTFRVDDLDGRIPNSIPELLLY